MCLSAVDKQIALTQVSFCNMQAVCLLVQHSMDSNIHELNLFSPAFAVWCNLMCLWKAKPLFLTRHTTTHVSPQVDLLSSGYSHSPLKLHHAEAELW